MTELLAAMENAQAVSRLSFDHGMRFAGEHAPRAAEAAARWTSAASALLRAGPSRGEAWHGYVVDACQRSLIMLDVLRQRGNAFHEHAESG
ncbi:MAG: hypothetical protein AB7O45_01195, partial [Alphaproteobacteria bacterium]